MATPIPQPKPTPILGNLPEMSMESPVQSLIELALKFDGLYRFDTPTDRMVVVYTQALVNEVCDEKRFDKKIHRPLEILRDLAGDGLFTAHTEENNWQKAHRLLMPAFGPMAIRDMFPKMLDIAEQLMLKIERYGEKETIDVVDEMTRLTLDTIAICAFDYRFNSFYHDNMHPFVHAMVDGLVEAGRRTKRLSLQQKLMFLTNRKFKQNVAYMGEVADAIITERKNNPSDKKDLLNLMLNSVDPVTGEKLSDENIRYQMITFLIAGHETTSGLLSFTVYLLLKNPEKMEKLCNEIEEVLGDEMPKIEHIAKLKYTDQVLKESLRLFPTAPAFGVTPHEDTIIGGQYEVKKGQTVLILPWMLHRDKQVWGEDVESFRPERFEANAFAQLPANSWKPFGNGQRACIGMPFAMQEATLVLAMLLQRFDLSLVDPNYELSIKETLTMKPEGFYIKAKRRNLEIKQQQPVYTKEVEIKTAVEKVAPLTDNAANLLILYGSNSGSSENFAQRMAIHTQLLGYKVTVGELNNYVDKLPNNGVLLIITASYEGQPTHNAVNFVEWLENLKASSFDGLHYAVLGCGHKDWVKTYQAIPRKIDSLLEQYGAKKLLDRGEADASGDFFGAFDAWQDQITAVLAQHFGHKASANNQGTEPLIEVSITNARAEYLQQNELQAATVLENRELVNMQYPKARSKRHIAFELPEGMYYRTGDYVSLLPTNPKNNVARVLKRYNLNEDTQILIKKNRDIPFYLPTGYPVLLMDILSHYTELAQPITKKQLAVLAAACPCPPEKKEILRWAEEEAYQKEVLSKRLSVLDILERFLSVDLPLSQFLEMLPPLKPRQYSISSSPLADAKKLTLTVGLVNGPAWSGQGIYEGVASNYLAYIQPGSKVKLITQASAEAFHLPEAAQTPIIMVAAGTGLAPFRGFMQERALLQQQGVILGKALLFFGCDHPDVDFLYKEQLLEWEKQAVVTIYSAFSELPEGDVTFVQHRLWAEREQVWQLIQENAKIFVCGDGKNMAPAVRKTFLDIYAAASGLGAEAAEQWMNEISKNGVRYAQDVFM